MIPRVRRRPALRFDRGLEPLAEPLDQRHLRRLDERAAIRSRQQLVQFLLCVLSLTAERYPFLFLALGYGLLGLEILRR